MRRREEAKVQRSEARMPEERDGREEAKEEDIREFVGSATRSVTRQTDVGKDTQARDWT